MHGCTAFLRISTCWKIMLLRWIMSQYSLVEYSTSLDCLVVLCTLVYQGFFMLTRVCTKNWIFHRRNKINTAHLWVYQAFIFLFLISFLLLIQSFFILLEAKTKNMIVVDQSEAKHCYGSVRRFRCCRWRWIWSTIYFTAKWNQDSRDCFSISSPGKHKCNHSNDDPSLIVDWKEDWWPRIVMVI